jgi:hypothetical protein
MSKTTELLKQLETVMREVYPLEDSALRYARQLGVVEGILRSISWETPLVDQVLERQIQHFQECKAA